jgi:hypothetical protein
MNIGKITITDTTGTTSEFQATALGLIENQHGYLLRLRDDGRIPSQELLDDIACYDMILKSPDPERMAHEYLDFKLGLFNTYGERVPVREAFRRLGWRNPCEA